MKKAAGSRRAASELPLMGSNEDSLIQSSRVRACLEDTIAKHRRPQAYKVMPELARRTACEMLV